MIIRINQTELNKYNCDKIIIQLNIRNYKARKNTWNNFQVGIIKQQNFAQFGFLKLALLNKTYIDNENFP